jgi:CheY-like chemotaxis protein
MNETHTLTAARVPTVYFIDDSATMREVIKIAFRKENIHVITCADAASALAQFGEAAPDAVITDVIMPDKDGYEVCDFVRRHETLARVPVILMSGIVNQSVAEKAMAVKADELIRKPFQPQDLIARVKGLIGVKTPSPFEVAHAGSSQGGSRVSSQSLSNLFAVSSPPVSSEAAANPHPEPPSIARSASSGPSHALPVTDPAREQRQTSSPTSSAGEVPKLRNEVLRLELLVKRLQAELAAGREYCSALEAHFKRLQESE